MVMLPCEWCKKSGQNTNDSDSTVGPDIGPAGAPVHEVTPAMIEAGVNALRLYLFEGSQVFESDQERLVVSVLEASRRVARTHSSRLNRVCPEQDGALAVGNRLIIAHKNYLPRQRGRP